MRFVLVAPQNRPRHGYVVYEDSGSTPPRRARLALEFARAEHFDAIGEVGDSDATRRRSTPSTLIGPTRSSSRRTGDALGLAAPRPDRARSRRDRPSREARGRGPRHGGTAVVVSWWSRTRPLSETSCSTRSARPRGPRGPASFLIVAPRGRRGQDAEPGAAAAQLVLDRCARTACSPPGRSAPRPVHRDRTRPRTSASTRSSSRPSRAPSGWLRRDLIERLRRDTGLPVDHVVHEDVTPSTASQEAASIARGNARAPAADPLQLADPPGDARHLPLHRVGDHALRLVLHRLLLRPVVNGRQSPWPPYIRHAHPVRPAVVPRAGQHLHPRHLELHDALGADLGQEGQPRRAAGRHGAHGAARPHLPAHPGHRVPPDRLQHDRHGVRGDLLRPDRPARPATSSSGSRSSSR